MTAPDPQPPAAPETDVSAWVAELAASHRDSYPMGNVHHGTPERPDWGTFCVECAQSWPCDVSRLLERVREVESERDAANVHAIECERIGVEAIEARIMATARAESAEAAHEALRKVAAELLALKDGPRDDDYARRKPAAWDALRALLAGGAR